MALPVELLLPEHRSFASPLTTEDIKGLPNAGAVYLLLDEAGAPILLASTSQLRKIVVSRLAAPPEDLARPRANLAEITRQIRWREVHSRFEADWWYYRAAKVLYPADYRKRLSFGPAWFLHVDWNARVPELRVTDRIWRIAGEFVGPFPDRAAGQQALEGLWDLFDLCRYPEQVRQAPHGQHCAYAEMGRCDAPCDGSAPLAAMIERTHAAWRFAGGQVQEWIAVAEERMREAAASLRFEVAGQLKQQIEFARRREKLWGNVLRREYELECLLLLPVLRRRAYKPFVFRHGDLISGPVCKPRTAARDVATWFPESAAQPPSACEDTTRMEQTWLVANLLARLRQDAALVIWSPGDGMEETIAQYLRAQS